MSRERHFVLSDSEKFQLKMISQAYGSGMSIYTHTNQEISRILPKFKKVIPADILSVLKKIKKGEGPDLITIKNFPVDSFLPEDESLNDRVRKKTRVSEICLLGVNALLDGVFQEEKSSHQLGFVHQVTPVKKFLDEASGRGGGSIPFHAENMFVKDNPSILSLFCLQGESGVTTEYLYVEDILQYVDEMTISILKEPIFTIVSGDGFDRKYLNNVAVLENRENGWRICRFYEEDRIFSDATRGVAAVETLHKAIISAKNDHHNEVELQAGTLLLFSNATKKNCYGGVLHGRRGDMSVKRLPAKNTGQRWLQRVCVGLTAVND